MESEENLMNVPVEIVGEQNEGEVRVETIREEWLSPEEKHDEEKLEENLEKNHNESDEENPAVDLAIVVREDDDALDNFEYEVEADAEVDDFVDEWMRIRNEIPDSDKDEDSDDDDDPYMRYERKYLLRRSRELQRTKAPKKKDEDVATKKKVGPKKKHDKEVQPQVSQSSVVLTQQSQTTSG
ncbi:unnamed protein product [Cochlearia groenlandica]